MSPTDAQLSRRRFLGTCAAAGVVALAPGSGSAQMPASQRRRPNILLLSTDQWHADAFGHCGNRFVNTPNSDRIAARSVSFGNAYATNPVCTPARSSWLTGRMPSEIMGVGNRVAKGPPDLGEWFGRHGYDTVHLGKYDFPGRPGKSSFRVLSGIHPTGQYADFTVAQMASSYLLDRSRDKPFLMHVALMNPHDICQVSCMRGAGGRLPIEAADLPPLPDNFAARPPESQALAQRVRRSQRRAMSWNWDETDWRLYRWLYYRYCESVDLAVGQVLDALDASGEADDTLLVYTSDHGDGLGHHGMHTKGFLYEESARVPLMLSMPQALPEGMADTTTLASGVDLFPTFCNVAGIPTPPDLCGVDLIQQHRRQAPPREVVVAEAPFEGVMARDSRHKLVAYRGDPVVQLFDLQEDPGETRSLTAELPAVVTRLTAALADFNGRLKPIADPATKPADDTGE